jgi:hypothetical protein
MKLIPFSQSVIEHRPNYIALGHYLVLSVFLLCTYKPAFSQSNIATTIDKPAMLIGDHAVLSIVVTYPAGGAVEDVDYSVLDELENFEVLNAEQQEKNGDNGNQQTLLNLSFTCWEAGTYDIPPIPVLLKDQAGEIQQSQSTAVSIQVATIPVEQDSVKLMPIKGIIDEPLNFRDVLPYLIGLVILLGIGLAAYLMRKKKTETTVLPPPTLLPAHQFSMEQLQQLEGKKLWQKGEVKQYHSRLTYILREYLYYRYDINALEQTTDEISAALKDKQLIPSLLDQLEPLLQTVDLVKFAKAEPPASFHTEAMEQVKAFVQNTQTEQLQVAIAHDGTISKYIPPLPSEALDNEPTDDQET